MFQKFVPHLGTSAPVCLACMHKAGKAGVNPPAYTITLTQTKVNVNPTFKNLFGPERVAKAVVCKTCGRNWGDYERTGRLGCSDCYKTFEAQLDSVIRQIHG